MKFNGITHILETPTRKFIAVGSVPMSMMQQSKPTQYDIMAGRVVNGMAYKQMVFDTAEDWLEHAIDNRVNVCESATCACHTLIGDLLEAHINRLVAMEENRKKAL